MELESFYSIKPMYLTARKKNGVFYPVISGFVYCAIYTATQSQVRWINDGSHRKQ